MRSRVATSGLRSGTVSGVGAKSGNLEGMLLGATRWGGELVRAAAASAGAAALPSPPPFPYNNATVTTAIVTVKMRISPRHSQ